MTEGIIIGIVFVGVTFLGTLFYQKRMMVRNQDRKEESVQKNKGCSILFYVFLLLLFIALLIAYLMYRKLGSN